MSRGWLAAFWVLWAFLMLSWILALCGLSSLQNNCYYDPGAALGGVGGVQGLTNRLDCADLYRLYWFFIAFLFVTLVGLAVCAAGGWLLASSLSWMAWMAVLSVLFIFAGDTFLGLREIVYLTKGVWFSRAATTAAGTILCAIFTLGMAFLLGWRQRRSSAGGGPMKV